MAMKIFTELFVLALVLAPNMAQSLQKCSCDNYVWDCSFREKSYIFPMEMCAERTWLLQHNTLAAIPTSWYSMNIVDVSYNLLGLNKTALVSFPSVKYLDLSSNYLKSLELLYNTGIVTLVAKDNEISNVKIPKTISIYNDLILARNKITNVPPGSLPTSLSCVDLSGNPLSTIYKEAFKGMNNLQILHLNRTQTLSELENGTFDGLGSLRILSLNNNQLMHLDEDLFSSLDNLEELFLHRNYLSELLLGIFRNLYRLRLLNLDNNQLTELPEELFSRLHSLEDLSVSSNYLKTLPVLQLCTGPISTVAFTHNLIDRIDEAAVRGLLRIGFSYGDLYDNPVDHASLTWIDDTTDMRLYRTSTSCQQIQMMSYVSGRGIISFCVSDPISTTTDYYTDDDFATDPY